MVPVRFAPHVMDKIQIWINAGESGTIYERNLATSDNPDQPLSKSLQIQTEWF